jgi:hypothetical protein
VQSKRLAGGSSVTRQSKLVGRIDPTSLGASAERHLTDLMSHDPSAKQDDMIERRQQD